MPYPSEHACRLNDPGKYDRFARKNCEQKKDGKCIDVIYGIKSGKTEIQALRFGKEIWSAASARAVCSDRGGSFEAASEASYTTVLIKSDGEAKYEDWFADDLQEWFKSHVDDEGNVNEDITIFKTVGLKQDGDGVWWTLSDASLDRDAERFDTSGWELKDYRKNPIVLWGHDKSRPAIGHMSKVKIEGEKLRGKITFDPKDVDEFSWMIGEKVKSGTIRAGSVGYKPTKIELVEDEKDPTKLIYRKQTLLEFSICNIPSNPNALADMHEKEEEAESVYATREELEAEVKRLEAEIERVKKVQLELDSNKKSGDFYDLFEKQESKTTSIQKDWFEDKDATTDIPLMEGF